MDQDNRSNGSRNEQENSELTIPRSSKDLKACANCGILLNTSQWKDINENCPNMCEGKPTKNYEGVACLMQPSRSWAAKRIGVKKQNILPGIYAIDIFDA